jgi:hypothetical protein
MRRRTEFEGVYFTLGTISIHQWNRFYEVGGINGLRLFQYIRTMQGLQHSNGKNRPTTFVKVNNKSLYKLFGVSQPKKWECLKKLEDEKMIEINREGKGKSPYVKIILPEKQYH